MAASRLLTAIVLWPLIATLPACTFVEPYNVTYKSVSTKEITNVKGIWGEYTLQGGFRFAPMEPTDIRYGGPTNARLDLPIPDKAGARWTNAENEQVEFLVPINKELFPPLGHNEHYQFVFELRQDDIRQVELIVHDGDNMRTKKKKVMLYCALPGESCKFNTPFTTDSFYDYESLTPKQLKKLREDQEAQRRIMESLRWDDIRKEVDEHIDKK